MLSQIVGFALHEGVAAILLAALLWMFVKAPRASVAFILVLAVLDGSREWLIPLGTSFGPINVSWADVATVLMGGVALGRLAWRHVIRPARSGIMGMAAMIGLGLVSWLLILGLQPAVNFWRAWTFAVAAALYASSTPRLREPGGLRPFVWAAVLASITQVIGIAREGFGSNMDAVVVNGESVNARSVTAAVALIMLLGMIALLLDGRKLDLPKMLLASWLAVSVVIAQHRSVWIAAAVAGVLLVGALVSNSRQRLVAGTLVGLGAAAVGVSVAAVIRSQQQLSASSSSTDTFEWRVDNWMEKLTTERATIHWLIGSVFGPTPLSDPQGDVLFAVSAHSQYVETIATLGVLGLLLLVLIVVGSIRGSGANTATRVIILSLLAFGVFYQWPGVTWIVIGVATADLSSRGRNAPEVIRRADSSTPSGSIAGLPASSRVTTR